MNLLLQNSWSNILPSSFETFIALHLLKETKSLAGQVDVLHHNNASSHTALAENQFWVKYEILVFEDPPYLLDLGLWDFFMFPKLDISLKLYNFESLEDLQVNVIVLQGP